MNSNFKIRHRQKIVKQLEAFIGVPESTISDNNVQDEVFDLVIKFDEMKFVVEYKSTGNTSLILHAIHQLGSIGQDVIPLIVVPYMGQKGKELCQEQNVSWMDLSGNANIVSLGLRILVEGKPNLFKQKGRPSNIFSPNSSRITHVLLLDPWKKYSHKELHEASGVDKGYISRILKKLEYLRLVERGNDGKIVVKDPELLLANWREGYSFLKHEIHYGHIASRSSRSLLEKISDYFVNTQIDHCFTGLSAAWLYSGFANYRTTSVYLKELPEQTVLEELGFREQERGSNVWMIIPKDEGVFIGKNSIKGYQCVSPVQTYLDLKDHPERAEEAAIELKKTHIRWSK